MNTFQSCADVPKQACKTCDRPVRIPGLDVHLCSHCGWVEGRSFEELAALKQGKRGSK